MTAIKSVSPLFLLTIDISWRQDLSTGAMFSGSKRWGHFPASYIKTICMKYIPETVYADEMKKTNFVYVMIPSSF